MMSDEFIQFQEFLKKKKSVSKTLKRNKSIKNFPHKPINFFSGYETTDEELQPKKSFNVIDTSLKMADFDVLRPLGHNGFCYNCLVKQKSTNSIYVLNKYKNITDFRNNSARICKNIIEVNRIPQVFHSGFIIKKFYQFYHENAICFIEEYYPTGLDFQKILSDHSALEETIVKFYIAELVLAIDCLHESNVIHGNLHLSNLELDSKGHLKLTGFELSSISNKKHIKTKKIKIIEKTENDLNDLKLDSKGFFKLEGSELIKKKTRITGTPDYIAPETLNRTQKSFSCDWWALGVILFEMIVGVPPFNDVTIPKILDNIKNLAIPWEMIKLGDGDDCMSENTADLIKKLLVLDPAKRITRNGSWDLKKHKFFKGIDWIHIRNSKAPIIGKLNI